MQVGPREIAQKLAEQAEAVCRYLIPGGKKMGNDWVAGSVHGAEGKSLRIAMGGSKAGIGADFADPDSFKGDLLDLWKAVRNCSMRDAIVEAKQYLGIEQANFRHKTYRKLDRPKEVTKRKSEVEEYLTTMRGLSLDTVKAFKVASTPKNEIVFPIMSPDGALLNCKYLGLERPDGRKLIRAEQGCAPSFYGWQAITKLFPDSAEVVITEGEIDAMTWVDAGFPALSVPSGANSSAEAIEYDWDNLAQFETIYLCPDNDKAGQAMVLAFADKLGKGRLRLVKLPFKDTNQARTEGGWVEKDFAAALMEAKGLLDEKIKRYTDDRAEVEAWQHGTGDTGKQGFEIELLGPEVRVVRGHTYLIGGQQGHGKTLIINQASLQMAKHDQTIAMASLEVKTIELMANIVALGMGDREWTTTDMDRFMEAWGDRFVFLNESRRIAMRDILEFFEYARCRFGCTQFVFDNLTKLKTKLDDYAQQGEDINSLTDWCRDKNVTVWILAHLKKKGEKKHEHDNDDVRGSGVISDLCSVILQVVRNKDKEQDSEPDHRQPDATVFCTKNRVFGAEPVIKLWKDGSRVVRFERRVKTETQDMKALKEGTVYEQRPAPYKDE